jgi:hypothetical protein
MNEKLKSVLLNSVPLFFYFATSMLLTKFYYDSSLRRLELCLKQGKESNAPDYVNICSNISSSSDWVYSQATSYFNPIIIMLLIMVVLLGIKINSMNKELNELKEKLDV